MDVTIKMHTEGGSVLIRACDIDRRMPAKRYTITVDDGRSISKDLCEEHGEPFEEWLEEAELGAEEAEPEPAIEPVVETVLAPVREVPATKKTTAKKTTTKKAATKKATAKKATTPRRRPKIMSLEEIEALKKG